MSGNQLDAAFGLAIDAIAGPARRSTRKRNAIESYGDIPSKDMNDFTKPDMSPKKKLRQDATSDLTKKDKKKQKSAFPLPMSGQRNKASTGLIKKGTKQTSAFAPPESVERSKSGKNADLENDDATELQKPAQVTLKATRKKETKLKEGEEKRLKLFRKKMPLSYESTIMRATTQRMFVVDRSRHHNDDCPHSTPDCLMETVDLAGTTRNIYTVTISHVPTCNCPNFLGRNPQCKHILYVLIKVLKAPDHLMYQAAFLTSELHEIFTNAGPLPTDSVSEEDKDGKRKPVEGDCPICCEELATDAEPTVWCKAACGNNLHKSCFDQWAATKGGGKVTCPYCRTAWENSVDGQMLRDVKKSGTVGKDGYVNVASQLGLSAKRDYSTYHSFWVLRQRRQGLIDDDENEDDDYDYDG